MCSHKSTSLKQQQAEMQMQSLWASIKDPPITCEWQLHKSSQGRQALRKLRAQATKQQRSPIQHEGPSLACTFTKASMTCCGRMKVMRELSKICHLLDIVKAHHSRHPPQVCCLSGFLVLKTTEAMESTCPTIVAEVTQHEKNPV